MKSFRKCLVFAVIAVMLVAGISCSKADKPQEPEKECVQIEESEQVEEIQEEFESEEEVLTEETLSEEENQGTLPDGTFCSTLFGDNKPEQLAESEPYISSVEVEDGYLVITGSFKAISDDMDESDDVDDQDDLDDQDDVDDQDDLDDQGDMDDQDDRDDTEFHEFDTYRFRITDETEFYAAGGSLGAISITLDEFIELAQYYNGLGMILEIEDGVIETGKITS